MFKIYLRDIPEVPGFPQAEQKVMMTSKWLESEKNLLFNQSLF